MSSGKSERSDLNLGDSGFHELFSLATCAQWDTYEEDRYESTPASTRESD